MRLSQFLPATLREDPSQGLPAGYRRLLRAGYLRASSDGVTWMPLGLRLASRVQGRLIEALEARGWARVLAHPGVGEAALLQSGRLPPLGVPESLRAPPPEGLSALVESYKRLPLKAFQFAWRNQAAQDDDLLPSSWRLRLEAWALTEPPDVGAIGGELAATVGDGLGPLGLAVVITQLSTEAHAPAELSLRTGGAVSSMLGCAACGFLARPGLIPVKAVPADPGPLLPMERVPTPGADSIPALCALLDIPPERTAKAMMFAGRPPGEDVDQPVMVLVRGDREVSWSKIAWASGWRGLRRAAPAEVEAIGASPGYASPVGLKHPWILIDQSVASSRNLVTGANQAGFHLVNTTCGRDYAAWRVADLAVARDGDACPRCGGRLLCEAGTLLGNCTPWLPERGEACGSYADRSGGVAPLAGVSLVADLTLALAALADLQADDRGLAWRPIAAPFAAQVIAMPSCEAQSLELHATLGQMGIEVLLDDREASPGVKLKDADLIGLPVRVIVGPKSIAAGGAEITSRAGGESRVVPLEDVGREILRLTA